MLIEFLISLAHLILFSTFMLFIFLYRYIYLYTHTLCIYICIYTALQKLKYDLRYCLFLLCIIIQLMILRTWNKVNIFIMKWLIEFYSIVALGTVCKRIIMKSVIKTCFWKSKIWIFFWKKTKWKKCFQGCTTDRQRCTNLQKLCHNLIFLFVYFFLISSLSFFPVIY